MSDVSLSSNFETRYWMQVLGVPRHQLEHAVRMVGTRVEAVMDILSVPERRLAQESVYVADERTHMSKA